MSQSIYDITCRNLGGKEIKLGEFRGKHLLVVNTASKCGFTPQYEGLEKLYQQYQDKGLVVLGFPCNQFGGQEPGTADDIKSACLINYGVSFPVFEKIQVNGKEAHALFKYLKKALPGFPGQRIKWNFTKFLIDNNGVPVKRFAPYTKPERIDEYLKKKRFV